MLRRERIIVLVTVAILFMAAFCPLALAGDESEVKTVAQTWVNPVYTDIETPLAPAGAMQAMVDLEPVPVATMDALRSVLTQAFANRETSLSVVYTGPHSDLSSNDNTLDNLDALLNTIITSDDYLQFNLQNWGYSGGGSDGDYQINFTVSYLTTLANEEYVDIQVIQILAELIAPHMNEHQKIKAIHDYIVNRITYNAVPLSGNSPHSAYTALHDGEAVCQGYALLAYRMLTEAGFEAKIISGVADNGKDGPVPHAWNRVKLDGIWYNLDCTWDDPDDEAGSILYNYYLLTDAELYLDHQKDTEHNGFPVYTDLPVANTAYFDTLNGMIRDAIEANDMDKTTVYLRLRQKLGLEYLFNFIETDGDLFNDIEKDKTVDTEDELKTMLQLSLQRYDSAFTIRYNNSIGDINETLLTRILNDIGYYNVYGYKSQNCNRGGASVYTLLEISFVYNGAPNQAPTAGPVTINGQPLVGEQIRGAYNFADAEDDGEALCQFQWYRGANADGSDKKAIPEAYAPFFIVSSRDVGKYLFFEVQPVAAAGTLSGNVVLSAPLGPITLPKAAAPTSNPVAGQVAANTEVTLNTTTAGASIYYTLDGSIPSAASTLYENPIVITTATTIKAIAIKDGMTNSDVAEFKFLLIALEKVAAPTSDVTPGAVASGTEITLSTTTAGASIYYTLNGSDPTADSTLYTQAIVISANTTIRAIAIKAGMANSDEAVFAYTIALEKAAAPTSDVTPGAVASGTAVTLSTTTAGASIYYTLNGSDPTAASTLYTQAIIIDTATTIRAIAIKDGMTNSDVAVFEYTITSGTDECFIATAAFGSKFDWPVALLRAFRDQYLLTNPMGTAFVDFYYNNSPPIAAFIANSEPLKALVRVMLAPIIAAVYLLYHPTAMAILLIIIALTGYILRIRRKIKTA